MDGCSCQWYFNRLTIYEYDCEIHGVWIDNWTNPYEFIEKFCNKWGFAIAVLGTLMICLLYILI